jgi:hypothetical protein
METRGVTELFELEQHDRGQVVGLAARRAIMTLFALIAVAALVGVIGQRASSSSAGGSVAALRLDAPVTVRGGLFFQAKLEVEAKQGIERPRFVFDKGWLEGLQVNSVEPAAGSETSRDGRLVLSYDELQPGDRLEVWVQFEVNPTNVGHRSFAVELDDGTQRLARVDRDLTVLP